MPTHSLTVSERRRATALLIAAIVCFWGALYLYVPILTPYAEGVGASMSMLGLIVSSYGFSQLVLRIPVGIWSDRIGKRKPFIVAADIAAMVAGLGLALSERATGILASRTMSGVAANHVGGHHRPLFQLFSARPGRLRHEFDQLRHHAHPACCHAGGWVDRGRCGGGMRHFGARR